MCWPGRCACGHVALIAIVSRRHVATWAAREPRIGALSRAISATCTRAWDSGTIIMLTDPQVASFFREGFLVCPSLAAAETIRAVRERGGAFVASLENPREGEDGRWTPSVFDHVDPAKDAALHALLKDDAVCAAATQLLGSPARVYYGMLAVVPPNGGHGLPWHQDNMYSHILGGALNCFVALETITPDKATLWVAPRSHLEGVRPNRHNTTTAEGHREALVPPDESDGVQMPTLHAGDVVIFDRYCLHRSGQNNTGTPRFAYAAQLAVGETVILLHPPPPFSRRYNRDGERASAK